MCASNFKGNMPAHTVALRGWGVVLQEAGVGAYRSAQAQPSRLCCCCSMTVRDDVLEVGPILCENA